MIKEQAETVSRANKDLIEKMLPVIDSFESGLVMDSDPGAGNDNYFKGLKLIYSKLMETPERRGGSYCS